jgi:2-keto-4-pentenoate hydratase
MTADRIAELAAQLHRAWHERRPIQPLSETAGLTSVEEAYAVQSAWTARQLAEGESIVGRKIGLTSRAVQEQMNVEEPDYGTLWASRWVKLQDGRGEVASDTFLQPRVEGEIAFLLGEPPAGDGDVTAADVLAATEAVAASIEIVDSRIEDWRITLPDTVADNASYGGFAVGPWTPLDGERRLADAAMTLSRNGEAAATGVGAAALGDPANAVAWLLNKLRSLGVEVRRGDIVLSGALAATLPAVAGDAFRLEIEGEPAVELVFT